MEIKQKSSSRIKINIKRNIKFSISLRNYTTTKEIKYIRQIKVFLQAQFSSLHIHINAANKHDDLPLIVHILASLYLH